MRYRQDQSGWADQPTEVIHVNEAGSPTEIIPVLGASGEPAVGVNPPPGYGGRRRAEGWLHWGIPAAVFALLVLVYVIDLAVTSGDIPRGTEVSGVEIGGLSKAAAERKLRIVLGPGQIRPVPVRAGALETTLEPAGAGLRIDWAGTVRAAGGQPVNPFTRFGSLFSTRETNVVTQPDDGALTDALDGMNTLVRKEPTDAGIRFDGVTPTAVQATPGEELDIPAAATTIRRQWLTGLPITLPVRQIEPTGNVDDADVQQTLTEIAKPAVAADVRVLGEGRQAILTVFTIAQALSFAPDGSGGLKAVLDLPKIEESLRPRLASTERPGKDAAVTLIGGQPSVTPSVDGRGVDYEATLAGLVDVLKRPASDPGGRELTAFYADQPAKLTTEQVAGLGIKGVISTFSTNGFAPDSGQNIRRAAETINGKILQPGETFSLNDATGRRDAAQGYVQAGVIEDGHPAKGIGGGVSQLATTLYNAAYFAGMTDVAHKEHSYYISRYPPAREATVFEDAIDLKFRNDGPTGVLIETNWTPSAIEVRFWGTKRYEVTSAPGPRTNPVKPQTLTIPAGQPCTPSNGGDGFTTTDTRTMREIGSGKSTSDTRTVRYKPSPKIVCAGGPTPAPR